MTLLTNRLSVALCTYNGARYLPAQLASIAAQSRLPDELIVSDDCSQDSTVDIVRDFARAVSFPVSIHVNDRNLGSTANFEQAIRRCSGDSIALSDQDDVWFPEKLAALENALSANPRAGLVFSNADVVDEELRPLGYTLWQSVRFNERQQRQVLSGQGFEVLLKHPVVTGATVAFRAAFREYLLPIPQEWVHDEWIALVIAMVGEITLVPGVLMHYRRHGANQIGAEGISARERLAAALSTDPAVYRKRASQYAALREHMRSWLPDEGIHLRALDGKIEHVRMRGTLPRAPLLRVGRVLRALLAGDYGRYSASSLNAARDLVLRHR